MWGGGETIAHTRQAQTVPFALPVPVGFSPQDIVIGASGIVNINDFARVSTVPQLRTHSSFGNIAAFGSTSKTNLGNNSVVGVAWSTPQLFLRGGYVEFYKSPQAPDVQAGTTFGQKDENRNNVTVRKDPVWTVSLPVEEFEGDSIFVNSGQTRSLFPGVVYPPVTVNSGGTLTFNGDGTFSLAGGLTVNTGGIVTFANFSPPRIFVGGQLILRSTVTRPGLILGYTGTSTAHLEGGFNGDLFIAPNADVEMKVGGSGHFFAKNLTVFEGQEVRGTVLSQAALDFIRPMDQATNLGEFSPDPAQHAETEIASAILTPSLTPSCSEPKAFISFASPLLFYRAVSTIQGASTPATTPNLPPPLPPPATCIGTALPGIDHNPHDKGVPPEPDPPLWAIQSGGRAFYSNDALGLDNLAARLPGGRAVQAGFAARWCEDPSAGLPQGSGCPATLPGSGASCDYMMTSGACIYPPTQCLCAPGCTPGGGPCTSASECCSNTCSMGSCGASGAANGTWVCGPLHRIEASGVGIRMSTNCGTSWTAGVFDAFKTRHPVTNHTIDRPEIHADPFDNKLYIAGNVWNSYGFFGTPYQSVYAAATSGIPSASFFSFQAVHPAEPRSTGFNVMTTVLDERARLNTSPVTYGRYVHLATFGCAAGRPILELDTPYGRRKWDIATDASGNPDPDTTTLCQQVDRGTNDMPFSGGHAGPSVVGVSSVPPRVRVAYAGVNGSISQIVNVYSITWRSAGGYAQNQRPVIVREHKLEPPGTGSHFVFPQLIAPDHLASSDLRVDAPVVLRYTEVLGDRVTERARVLYSGIAGPPLTIAEWSISETFPGIDCTDVGCFVGDYRYGSFFEKAGGNLKFFTPWTGKKPAGNSYPVAYAATVDVIP